MTGHKFWPSFGLVLVLVGLLCALSGRLSPTGSGNIRHLEFVRVCEAQGLTAMTGDPDDLLSYAGRQDSLRKHLMDPNTRYYGGSVGGGVTQFVSSDERLRNLAELFMFVIGKSQDWFWLTY